MIKTIIAATVASTISFSSFAADSSHCNSLDHGPQFNKTELSAFDKCWINTHKADENSGVDGNIFWVKVGDDIVSMPVKKLAESGSKNKIKETIKTMIVEKIIEVESGSVIDALKATIEDLELAEADGLVRIAQLMGDITRIESQLSTITANNSYNIGTINDMLNDFNIPSQLTKEAMRTEMIALSGRLRTDITTLGQQVATLRSDKATVEATLADVRSDLAASRAANLGFAQRLATLTRNHNRAYGIAEQIDSELAAGTLEQYAALNPTTLDNYDISGRSATTGVDNVSNVYSTNGQYAFRIGNTEFISEPGRWNTILNRASDLVEKAYDEGYQDGYEAGYNDGYADGFRDGVNSTQ